MKTENKIELLLKYGYQVIEKDAGRYVRYEVINGDIFYTPLLTTIEEAKNYAASLPLKNGMPLGFAGEIIETFIPLPEKTIPAGTKVRVRENAKDMFGWPGYEWLGCYDKTVGKICTVNGSGLHGIVIEDEKKERYIFPICAVEIVFEEDKTDNLEKAKDLLRQSLSPVLPRAADKLVAKALELLEAKE